MAVCPSHLHGLPACQTAFQQFAEGGRRPGGSADVASIRRYFIARDLHGHGQIATLSVADIDAFPGRAAAICGARVRESLSPMAEGRRGGVLRPRGERTRDGHQDRPRSTPHPSSTAALRPVRHTRGNCVQAPPWLGNGGYHGGGPRCTQTWASSGSDACRRAAICAAFSSQTGRLRGATPSLQARLDRGSLPPPTCGCL